MKKKSKSKSPIQIIAAIGLVIAILWTAKGFFQFGSAGYKEVKSKVSKKSNNQTSSSVLDSTPKLRCKAFFKGELMVDHVYDLSFYKISDL